MSTKSGDRYHDILFDVKIEVKEIDEEEEMVIAKQVNGTGEWAFSRFEWNMGVRSDRFVKA